MLCEVVSLSEVIGGGDTNDFDMTSNGGICGADEMNELRLSVCTRKCTKEDPLAASMALEILVLDPSFPFVRVSAHCPLPESFEDCIVH